MYKRAASTRLPILLPVLLFVALACMCATGQPYRLTVYYSGPEGLIREVERAFESYRGDVLDIRELSVETLDQADIVWGAGDTLGAAIEASGRLHPYRSSQTAALTVGYAASRGYYTVSTSEYLVVAYNTDSVTTAPTRWADLPTIGRTGHVSVADPSTHSATFCGLAALAAGPGWALVEELAAARPRIVSNTAAAAQLLESGDVAAALLPYHEAAALSRGNPRIRVLWPQEGAPRIGRPIAILRQEGRPAVMTGLAEQFVDYALSRQGQSIAGRYGLWPGRGDVPAPTQVPVPELDPDGDWIISRENELRVRFGALFGAP